MSLYLMVPVKAGGMIRDGCDIEPADKISELRERPSHWYDWKTDLPRRYWRSASAYVILAVLQLRKSNMMLPPHTQELLRRFAERGSATVEDILAKPADDRAAPRSGRTPEELIVGQIAISDRCAELPVLDARTPDEIIGDDNHGSCIP
jgi:hypothetical protein